MDYRELRGEGENPSPDPLGWLYTVDISNLVLSVFNSVSVRLLAPSTYRSQPTVVGA